MKIEGILINVEETAINEIIFSKENCKYYPFVTIEKESNVKLFSPSPIHGRSLISYFDENSNRYIITKGNGLTYFPFGFVSTLEFENHIWGFLNKDDAIRDYKSGEYINGLGILTNKMESVYSLNEQVVRINNDNSMIMPYILQYSVECPYRIADIPLLSANTKNKFIKLWTNLTEEKNIDYHCLAADVILRNIKIMHENDVLHNSIHIQNYTLSLELLDFELARTPVTPYENSNDDSIRKTLLKREIIQSLEIVNHIAYYLKEKINVKSLRNIMSKYGYENYLFPE